MRSRTGCLTCRNRKLKCDEQKPVCGQCTKANRNCVASPGVIFRHQQNASLNGESESATLSTLRNFYGYKETFGKDNIWVAVPKQLTFVNTTNPYKDPGSPIPNSPRYATQAEPPDPSHEYVAWRAEAGNGAYSTAQGATTGLEALSAAASGDSYLDTMRESNRPSLTPRIAATQATTHLASAGDLSPLIDPQFHDSINNPLRQSHSTAISLLDDQTALEDFKHDDDVPLLLRFFSEGPGAWMDLFDQHSYFSVHLPVKATSCPMLLYAAIALSAKALAYTRVSAHYVRLPATKHTPSKWLHKARLFYNRAIGLLRHALDHGTVPGMPEGSAVRTSDQQDACPITIVATNSIGQSHLDPDLDTQTNGGDCLFPRTDSNELLATTAVLCVYEFLDASSVEWSRHLDGAKSLFEIATDGALPLMVALPEQITYESSSSRARRAIFWNICRQEMIDAFISNKSTRLDTSDITIWQAAGLHISSSGYVLPSNRPDVCKPMEDDMVANALIWLIMKLVNFIAAGDEFPHELGLGIRQKQLLDYWEDLEKQLDAWHEGLPDSFRPTSTVWPRDSKNELCSPINIPKQWYARPLCASAMQSFHFAKIQLWANKPHLSTGLPYTGSPSTSQRGSSSAGVTPSSLAQRHASYMTILRESKRHAEDIVGISLALTSDSARVHSVQPLFTAGQVLGNEANEGESKAVDEIRRCILDLLQGVQRETGWATEYRMRNLLEIWHWPGGERARADPSISSDSSVDHP
ncbi:hypothetical protein AAFC00_001320 [Neodothiora populina]|uniref:Zn(2)-C6 fungal-type domain-containing protein n=1 Tax=Neodothiora populina TaxID=2781224 RepID=A0ABR3PNH8_9PEZI